MPKLTMQDIANAAGVSRITVWKALNNRTGVSEAMRQTIRQKAAELGYGGAGEAGPMGERTFSVVVSRPESSAFWMQIIHHIAKELSVHRINLMYTYMPSAYAEGYALPTSLSAENVDGFIALNIYDESSFLCSPGSRCPRYFWTRPPPSAPTSWTATW